jgi:hypothetical protein
MYSANRAKIIPFPGVPLNPGDGVQITPDGFLKEMGYVKNNAAHNARDVLENVIDNFLREMGYAEYHPRLIPPEKRHIE